MEREIQTAIKICRACAPDGRPAHIQEFHDLLFGELRVQRRQAAFAPIATLLPMVMGPKILAPAPISPITRISASPPPDYVGQFSPRRVRHLGAHSPSEVVEAA
jgi:hypothetical protein